MKKLRNKALLMLAFIGLLSVQTNAQAPIVENFATAGGTELINGWANWNAGFATTTFEPTTGLFGDGALRIDRITNNAGIRNQTLSIDPAVYDVIKLRYKNLTDGDQFRVQGSILSNTGVNGVAKADEWTTFYIDFSGTTNWTTAGTISDFILPIRRNAPDAAGDDFFLDEITFLTAMPTVDVTNPALTSGTTATAIDENSGAAQVIYTATATDNVAVLYYDISGTDAASFTINKATGAVTLTEDPNFENKENYSFDVTAYDDNTTNGTARNSATQTVTLAINDIVEGGDNTAPVISSGATATAIAENSGTSQAIYTIVATDDTAVTSYGLEAGDDAASFSISGAVITLTGNPDFETKSSYTFTVSASDAAANKGTLSVTLAITDVGEDFSFTFDTTVEGFLSNGSRGSAFGTENVWDAGSGSNTGLLVINGLETVDGTSGVSDATNINAYGPAAVNTGNATHLTIVLRNKTIATQLKLRAKPNGGSYSNVALFTITANDTDFKTYTFDLSGLGNWAGAATEYSIAAFSASLAGTTFDPANINLAIDSIEFTNEAPATTDGTWEAGATWTGGETPGNGAPKSISGNVTINSDVVSTGPITLTAGSLTVKAGHSLVLTGDLVTNNSVILEAGAQMIINGASTGTASFTRTLPAANGADALLDGWFSMSPPFSGATINNAWATSNGLATSANDNRGLATYLESGDSWVYLMDDDANVADLGTTFQAGKGYIVKQTTPDDIVFTGTVNTNSAGVDVTVAKAGNGFNLLGNPYSSLVNSSTFLTDTDNSGLFVTSEIWVWNDDGNNYNSKPSGMANQLAPGQSFFVQVNVGGTLNFKKNNQTIGGDTFQKSADTKIKLMVADGSTNRFAEVYYLDNATLGYDNGYEGKVFKGLSQKLSIYTQMLEGNETETYQIQSLPNTGLETMVVPVGVKATAGKEITFSVDANNIPSGLKVFLEDRQEGVFTQLDILNSEYKVNLTDASNGTGRFFLHTRSSALSTDDVFLNSISIFKSDNSTLKVAGLKNGKASISIFNILGKQVMNKSFTASNTSEYIALPNLKTGVYIVQLTTEEGKLNKKIILE